MACIAGSVSNRIYHHSSNKHHASLLDYKAYIYYIFIHSYTYFHTFTGLIAQKIVRHHVYFAISGISVTRLDSMKNSRYSFLALALGLILNQHIQHLTGRRKMHANNPVNFRNTYLLIIAYYKKPKSRIAATVHSNNKSIYNDNK